MRYIIIIIIIIFIYSKLWMDLFVFGGKYLCQPSYEFNSIACISNTLWWLWVLRTILILIPFKSSPIFLFTFTGRCVYGKQHFSPSEFFLIIIIVVIIIIIIIIIFIIIIIIYVWDGLSWGYLGDLLERKLWEG